MPYKTKKSKTKSGKKTAKNPCRVIRVKRKTGKSKLDRVVYARRKVCFNPIANPYMYIENFIMADPQKYNFMKSKYGGFYNGVIDDMNATYAYEIKKRPGLTPEEFYNWYMKNDIDLRNAREVIFMKETSKDYKDDMRKFIIHVEAFNRKQKGIFAQLISRLRRKNPCIKC